MKHEERELFRLNLIGAAAAVVEGQYSDEALSVDAITQAGRVSELRKLVQEAPNDVLLSLLRTANVMCAVLAQEDGFRRGHLAREDLWLPSQVKVDASLMGERVIGLRALFER